MKLREVARNAERRAIVEALRADGAPGRLGRIAEKLGVSRKNIWEKMRDLGISKDKETPQLNLPFQESKELKTLLMARSSLNETDVELIAALDRAIEALRREEQEVIRTAAELVELAERVEKEETAA